MLQHGYSPDAMPPTMADKSRLVSREGSFITHPSATSRWLPTARSA
jgi:hypothetical protein